MSTIFEVRTKEGRTAEKKCPEVHRPIYIIIFIFIYIYIVRRKVDRTRIDAGLGDVRAQDSCGMVGQMSHALFCVLAHKDLVIVLNAPLKATLPTPNRLGLSS
jgi:hypothetical protein